MLITKLILLSCIMTLTVAQKKRANVQKKPVLAIEKPTVAQENPADLLFKIPDIQTTYTLENGDELTLVAYKTHETNDLISQAQQQNRALMESETSRLNWMTAGICSFVQNRIIYRRTNIELGLRCLNDHIRTHLANKASEKHGIMVSSDRILLLPFSQVICRADVADPITKALVHLHGEVTSFKNNPLTLDINAPEESLERTTFKHLHDKNETIAFYCDLFANGKTELQNQLKINFREESMAEVVDHVLGDANSAFVTRNQMAQLSQELYTTLNIEEVYEMPESTFSNHFVKDFINLAATQAFHEEGMKQALVQLSKYSVDFSADLSPDIITRDIQSIFSVNNTDKDTRVTLNRKAYDKVFSKYGLAFSDRSSDSLSQSKSSSSSGGAGVSVGFKLIEASVSGSGASSSSSSNSRSSNKEHGGTSSGESDKTESSDKLNDKLHRLSSQIVNQVGFEFDGRRVVPKTLAVAKLLRAKIKRQMKFSRIRKTLHNAPFHETVRVVLNDATTFSLTPHALLLINKLNVSIAALKAQTNHTFGEIGSVYSTEMKKMNQSFAEWKTETNQSLGYIGMTYSKEMKEINQSMAVLKTETNFTLDSLRMAFTKEIEKTRVPVGTIIMWTNSTIPSGWLLCDGQSLSRADYKSLFDVIGTTFGSNDSDTFNLPSLSDRFPLGAGNASVLGETGGEKDHLLIEAEMPKHSHTMYAINWNNKKIIAGISSCYAAMHMSCNNAGIRYWKETSFKPSRDARAHNNMPPYIGIHFVIKV